MRHREIHETKPINKDVRHKEFCARGIRIATRDILRRLYIPINAITLKPYQGKNEMTLRIAGRLLDGGADPRWCTFIQAQSKGWKVKKGAHGTKIEFWSELLVQNKQQDSKESKLSKRLMRRVYTVFHASQIDGIS